jgi:hypothetical protein
MNNERFSPQRGLRDASIVDVLFDGVCLAAPVILERAVPR